MQRGSPTEAASSLSAVVTETFNAHGYEVATAPAEGVLRLTPSVTDLDVNGPDVPAPGMQRTFVRDGGMATLSLEVRDAATGTLLARMVDRGTAREIRLNNRATSVSNQFWFDALFRQWAAKCADDIEGQGFRRLLARLSPCAVPGGRRPPANRRQPGGSLHPRHLDEAVPAGDRQVVAADPPLLDRHFHGRTGRGEGARCRPRRVASIFDRYRG